MIVDVGVEDDEPPDTGVSDVDSLGVVSALVEGVAGLRHVYIWSPKAPSLQSLFHNTWGFCLHWELGTCREGKHHGYTGQAPLARQFYPAAQ